MNRIALPVTVLLLGLATAACTPHDAEQSSLNSTSTAPADTVEQAKQDASQTMDAVGEIAADAALTAKVKGALAAEDTLSALAIDVDSNSGVVTLSGEVDSAEQKQVAVLQTASVEGVVTVEDRLTVRKQG
ncbi:BON domain-containing protein [Chitinibacteraceae bacterium HSL-7]